MTIGATAVWIVIVATGAGSLVLRAGFIIRPSWARILPEDVRKMLRMVPPAALAALVVPAVVKPEAGHEVAPPDLFAMLIAFVVAWRWRNAALTIVAGLVSIIVLQAAYRLA
jgi:branched-subunit amino acid transport protein